ncbi:MAG TPA: hypothetical protein VFM49_14175 [Chloroflexia bacterium]|nr:hypothetical protein [Chloroflexia bacterium]
MARMIAHAKLLVDDLCDAAGPDGAAEAPGCGARRQQRGQLGQLGGGETGAGAGGRVGTQGVHPAGGGALQPLTDRTMRDAQGGSDTRLRPALLV